MPTDHALIAITEDEPTPEGDDRVAGAFLAFLEKDLKERPGRRTTLSKASVSRAARLTSGVKVRDDEALPEDVTF